MPVRHRSARRHRRLRGRNGRPGGGVRSRRLSLGFALQADERAGGLGRHDGRARPDLPPDRAVHLQRYSPIRITG